jgi:hypothetical protein
MKDLPQGLPATFIRCLTKIHARVPSSRDRLKRALRWVVCATRPLSLDELAEALAVEEMQDTWDTEKVVSVPESIVDDCANLLIIVHEQTDDSSRTVVKLIHASVRDFLISTPGSSEIPLQQYHVPLEDGHIVLARQCFKYFTAFSNYTISRAFRDYAVRSWTKHVDSSGAATQVLEELMQSSVVTHPNDLVDLYPNVTHVSTRNCMFIFTPGNQYNVFLNGCDPSTDFGRFSFNDLFPQLTLDMSLIDCTATICTSSTNIYEPITADPATAKISFDPSASHVYIENFMFNHVHGTKYDIFPSHRTIISKHCDCGDVGLFNGMTGSISIVGGTFTDTTGAYNVNRGAVNYKLYISHRENVVDIG